MPKSKHRKKTPKRKPKPNKPIIQKVEKATLNDTAQDIIDLYGDYMMTPEYDNIPDTTSIIQIKEGIDRLINQIQSGNVDNDELAATLDDYFLDMQDAFETRGFVIGYQYAKTYTDDGEEERIIYSDDEQIIAVSDNLIDEEEDDIDNE